MIICNVWSLGNKVFGGMLKMADGNYNAELTAKVVSTEPPTPTEQPRSDGA